MTTPVQVFSAIPKRGDDRKQDEQLQKMTVVELRQLWIKSGMKNYQSLSKTDLINGYLALAPDKPKEEQTVAKRNMPKEEQAVAKRKMEHEGEGIKVRIYKSDVIADPTPKCFGCTAVLNNTTLQRHTEACKARFLKKFQELGDRRVSARVPEVVSSRVPDVGDEAQDGDEEQKRCIPLKIAPTVLASHCQCGNAFPDEAIFCTKCGSKRPPATIANGKNIKEQPSTSTKHARPESVTSAKVPAKCLQDKDNIKMELASTPSRRPATTRRPPMGSIKMQRLQKALVGREAKRTPVMRTPMKRSTSTTSKLALKTPMKRETLARRKSDNKPSRSGSRNVMPNVKRVATKQEVTADSDVKITKAFKLDDQSSGVDLRAGLKGKVQSINSDGHALISFDGFESQLLVAKEHFGNLEVMCNDGACQIDEKNIWWKCSKCSFTIPLSVPAAQRCGRKSSHLMFGKCKHNGIALRRNFKSRSRLLRSIWEGHMTKTKKGLTKEDLMVSWRGRIVPKKRSAHSKKMAVKSGWAANWRHWCRAHKAIRQEMGITHFFKVKKNGTAEEKKNYMKIVERSASSYATSINEELQKHGSRKQLTLASFTSSNAKEEARTPKEKEMEPLEVQ